MYDKELLELKKKLDKMLALKTAEYKQGYKDGYAKAINDFSETLKKELGKHDFWKYDIKSDLGVEEKDVTRDWMIDEIAEQMKGGAIDG